MADYVPPEGWLYDGAGNKDQTTYVVPGNTAARPYHAVFDRKVPSVNNNGTFSNSQFRVRLIRSVLDSEGNLVPGKLVGDATFSWPIAVDTADVTEVVQVLGAMLSDTEFQNNVLVRYLPRVDGPDPV